MLGVLVLVLVLVFDCLGLVFLMDDDDDGVVSNVWGMLGDVWLFSLFSVLLMVNDGVVVVVVVVGVGGV